MQPQKIVKFIKRQWNDVRKGGRPFFRYKINLLSRRIRSAFELMFFSVFFFIPLVIIRCIRPWLLVRFGRLESSGIGHFSLPTEIYLSEAELGLHDPGQEFVDIWYLDKIICNSVLKRKWSHFFNIWPRRLICPIDRLNRFLPAGKSHIVPYRYIQDRNVPWQNIDIHEVLDRTEQHITFSSEEEAEGFRAFRKMGIGENDQVVCFVVRDGAYHSGAAQSERHRNASVNLLLPAMELVTKWGYKAVRMGAKVNEAIQTSNSSIIDYSTNGMRTELLDLFLAAHCRFMVSNATGVDFLAPTFRRPLIHVNIPQVGFIDEMGKRVLFTPKHFWSIHKKRMLSFSEIFETGAHLFTLQMQHDKEGIKLIDNTPEEICSVVIEMEQRLLGTWRGVSEDEILQDRFRSIWPVRPNGRPLQARIGAEFLRVHQELLS